MERIDVPEVGSKPPGFALRDTHSEALSLAGLHADKDVLLVFYRGWW